MDQKNGKMQNVTEILEHHGKMAAQECLNRKELFHSRSSGLKCPPEWDTVLCWPETVANSLQRLPCPRHVPNLDHQAYATRWCTANGTWMLNPEGTAPWTNYTDCRLKPPPDPPDIRMAWLPFIKGMSNVGYAVSFVALVLAFFILMSIKKLRCPRNTLHMHLFMSFMLRASMSVLKSVLFVEGLGLPSSISFEGESGPSFNTAHSNWACKLVISIWQYAIVANYSWIFMEGMYLHNLIFLAPFSDSSAITLYVILGWGCPIPVVGSWILSRIFLDDTLCWTTHHSEGQPFNLFLLIKVPIVLSIVLNFVLFLNIIRVLLVKLQSAVSIESKKYRYRKWAKSTLVLVPLFGVHYMAFIGMSYYVGKNAVIEVVWLFCDQLFASFQGFFVSVLYCLLNGEVRSELRKLWGNWRSDDGENSIPMYRISSKFRSTQGGTNDPNELPELTEEQNLNDLSCDDKRKRGDEKWM